MSYQLGEWLNLALRWIHVVAAILWIGQTALFSWLDSRVEVARAGESDGERAGRSEAVWMVHSGGFYRVDKRPWGDSLPPVLHWFRWESAWTWTSGFLLLLVVYYRGGLLVAPDAPLGWPAAAAIGLGTLVGGWLAYDALWRSPLARHGGWLAAACFAALVPLAWGLSLVLSGRAAYLHVGALLGTVMAANVWMRILPNQKLLVAAATAGREPDLALAAEAKRRSRHNTYLALPVVFLMISHHFPIASYGHRLNWLMLGLFVFLGLAGRWAIDRWEGRNRERI